ncbi:zinc finger, CCHC-type containing protein [Tanacetum coccineum]
MGRFEKAIFKQREEINDRMAEMFKLLKELTKSRTSEKVLIREEVSNPITKHVNAISLVRMENDKDNENDEVVNKNVIEPIELVNKVEVRDDETDDESDRIVNEEPTRWGKYAELQMEMPRLQLIGYYLKHEINEKKIEGLVDNHKYNDSFLAVRLGIAEDVLIDVAGYVYLMDFVILDIEEDECMPLILGTPFLTTAKAEIKFDKGTMTIRAGKHKIRFVKTREFPSKIKERTKKDLDPITPTNHVNRRILEWEARIKNHQESEIGFKL